MQEYLWKSILNRLFDDDTWELIIERVLNEIQEMSKSNLNWIPIQSSFDSVRSNTRSARSLHSSSKSPKFKRYSKFLK